MPAAPKLLSVERKGIEFVPLSERYGTARRLFTVWFGGNLSLLCLTTGTLGILAGLPLGWTWIALALGNAIGTVFMAAHSAQGPHLGIPQMIQSRAQFGVLGAGLPLLTVVSAATLYSAANGILIRDTINLIAPVGDAGAMVIFALLTLGVAYIGYELIHRIGAALSIVSGVLFLAVVGLLAGQAAEPSAKGVPAHFTTAAFMLVVTQGAAWGLSSGPYVADYSRYLPVNVSAWKTFWYTALGNYLGSVLIMALGAYITATRPDMSRHLGIGIANLFGRVRFAAAILIVVNLLQVNVMNLYTAYMASTTIVTGLRGMNSVALAFKLTTMGLLMTLATVIAIAAQNRFDVYFSDFLSALLYGLVPWSAINLADYYLVRKGRYALDQMFMLDGIYGRYRWKTIAIYLLSIALQAPFMSLSFYVGPVARLIGADISWLPGLAIPAVLYCALESRRD